MVPIAAGYPPSEDLEVVVCLRVRTLSSATPKPMHQVPDILLLTEPIATDALHTLVARFFEDMVKYVVDVERGIAAVGGELHADAKASLLEDGSSQEHLWGANYYPGRGPEGCIEFTSLINIRPSQGNPSMVVMDEGVQARMRDITFLLIGRGGALP